jgi:serine/threonine-protein kinase
MIPSQRGRVETIESSPFHAGMLVTPHVRLVEPLAIGGMGELWVGRHLTLATDVVVKFVRPCFHDNATVIARFHREARAAARLSSPHVVRHFDHGLIDEPHPYIVMERLHGMSLAEGLMRGLRLDLEQTAELVRQLARALGEAHAANIIHRDIKPENVFLCDVPEGLHVKLLDFGVAAITGAPAATLTQPGTLVGTPSYLSPELVLTDAPADEHADFWAVAAVAYEALTGKLAFAGETVGAVCSTVARCKPTPPSAIDPRLPREVDAWFKRALHRDRAQRFQSARELASSLARIAGTPSERATVPDTLSRRSWAAPEPQRITLGATAISRRVDTQHPRSARGWRLPIAALVLLFVGMAASRLLLDRADEPRHAALEAPTAAASTSPPATASVERRSAAAPSSATGKPGRTKRAATTPRPPLRRGPASPAARPARPPQPPPDEPGEPLVRDDPRDPDDL